VHNRACRYFLGVGKYTANAAVQGDTGLLPPMVGQWETITRQWCRMCNMADDRLNKVIFKWAFRIGNKKCKNWIWTTSTFYKSVNLGRLVGVNLCLNKDETVKLVSDVVRELFFNKWQVSVRSVEGSSRTGGNKLRTYRNFKQEFSTELYVTCMMDRKYRRAMALFRCGNAPIRIETGRYEGLEISERLCLSCESVEDEMHVLVRCPLYDDVRQELFNVFNAQYTYFNDMSDVEKTCFILANDNVRNVLVCAKYCYRILERRKQFNLL